MYIIYTNWLLRTGLLLETAKRVSKASNFDHLNFYYPYVVFSLTKAVPFSSKIYFERHFFCFLSKF